MRTLLLCQTVTGTRDNKHGVPFESWNRYRENLHRYLAQPFEPLRIGPGAHNVAIVDGHGHPRMNHVGRIRVRGVASHGLRWKIGRTPGKPPLLSLEGERILRGGFQ